MDLVNCDKVYVKKIDDSKGLGVFARNDIESGEIIEIGVARRIDTDGHKNNYLFTWSEDRQIWAFLSGCSTFYNTSMNPNCIMDRNFDEDIFQIKAIKDIKKDEELTHKYRSLEWRKCFKGLHEELSKSK